MLFKPLARDDSFETIGYWELCERLIQTATADAPVQPQSASDIRITAEQRARVLAAIRNGDLEFVVFVEVERLFYRVPKEHWARDGFLEGEPGEKLHCWADSSVPVKFWELPLLFFTDEVSGWAGPLPEVAVAGSQVIPPGRGRRRGVGGYASQDAPLIEKMDDLIRSKKATSVWDAARQVESNAKGADTNRRKRLAQGYKRTYPSSD